MPESEETVNKPRGFKKILPVLLLFLSLPLLILAVVQVTSFLSKASVRKANIVVDAATPEGNYSGGWLNFAQGGEEVEGMLTRAVSPMKLLKPKYIRLDHIFDNYNIVREGGVYNFEKLDVAVSEILAMGAKPFFALSYMPRVFTDSQNVIDAPRDWTLWQNLIKATIEHYSGRKNKNILNVYYEVWNEPDLPQFGGWKIKGEKNYNTLYHYAANGARDAQNTNKFYFGGPAVGSYYQTWVSDFISYVRDNNLRLDFYSWHRYHTSPDKFREDALAIRNILSKYPGYESLPLALTEWGIDSANNQNSGNDRAASHALSTVFKIHDVIALPFAFEVKDGPPPQGGKWGLITHERDTTALNLKPRFKAFSASSLLTGEKLKTIGWGGNVQALSGRSSDGTINILITNYDWRNSNFENVPLTLTGLKPGAYSLITKNITVGSTGTSEVTSTDGQIKKEIPMLPNTTVLISVKQSGNVSEYITGASLKDSDKALILANNKGLYLSPVNFAVFPNAELKFDIKPIWGVNQGEINILKTEVITNDGHKSSMMLSKTTSKNINFLFLKISDDRGEIRLAAEINSWQKDRFHKISLGINPEQIRLTVDGTGVYTENTILSGESSIAGLNFYPTDYALDNLEIIKNGDILFARSFD